MSSSLSDQLGQLRDRQRRLIEQIADELVMADKEVEGKIAAELAPLQAEVERLRQSLQQVVQEKEEKAIELEELQEEIRAFFHRATDTKPKRATAYSTSAEPATPSAEKPRPLKVTLPKVKKERKPFRFKRLAVRTVAVAVVAAGLFFGWHQFTATVNRNMAASGQVAGVSTNRPATKGKGAVSPSMSVQQAEVAQAIQDDPNDPSNHPEIYAQTPFKQTAWATIHDPDFGISLQYPKSNTYPVHSPGGDNYWFPRGENSFFFKISRTDDVNQQLGDWITSNKGDYSDYTFSQTTFLNNQTAWLATPNTHTAASMRQYFLQHDKYIYIIGVLEKPANADDQQRLNQMLNSIQFLSVSS